MDPLAEKYYSLSPYVYCAGDPINNIDYKGLWIPNHQGNLTPEEGDSIESLAVFMGWTYDTAHDYLQSQGFIGEDGLMKMKIGEDVLCLDNPFTQSIASFPEFDLPDYCRSGPAYYNCWTSAIAGTSGKSIDQATRITNADQFDEALESSYDAISSAEAVFGKTVIRMADDNNIAQHGMVFYGIDSKGVVYVYSKNGWFRQPCVIPLKWITSQFLSYGTIKGYNSTHSGYYLYSASRTGAR